MNINEEVAFLKKRVKELEKQLDNLRLSRRVLMDLLEQIEKEKNMLSAQLEKRVKRGSIAQIQVPKKMYTEGVSVLEFAKYQKK